MSTTIGNCADEVYIAICNLTYQQKHARLHAMNVFNFHKQKFNNKKKQERGYINNFQRCGVKKHQFC